MNREDKSLLFKDLSTRLPYGVKLQKFNEPDSAFELYSFNKESGEIMFYKYKGKTLTIGDVGKLYRRDVLLYKPFLRPLSSMTEEEKLHVKLTYGFFYHDGVLDNVHIFEAGGIYDRDGNYYPPCEHRQEIHVTIEQVLDFIHWLNAHHFDYRGLIEKGLAIEAPKGMYDLNKK